MQVLTAAVLFFYEYTFCRQLKTGLFKKSFPDIII